MNYGIFLSAQGAQTQSRRLEVIANNMANADTTAFKRDLAIFQAHHTHDVEYGIPDDLPGNLNSHSGGTSITSVETDFSEGPLQQTGGTYDVALSGDGFLHVTNGQKNYLTRNGALTTNHRGELMTSDGYKVLNTIGEPVVFSPNLKGVEIGANGAITELLADGSRGLNTQIAIVQPDSNNELYKVGNSLYRTDGDVHPAEGNVQLKQGFLEGSGTNSVAEMMEMIEATRAFETNLNMIKHQDESLGRLLQSVGRQ